MTWAHIALALSPFVIFDLISHLKKQLTNQHHNQGASQ